jgi:basic membrane protein A
MLRRVVLLAILVFVLAVAACGDSQPAPLTATPAVGGGASTPSASIPAEAVGAALAAPTASPSAEQRPLVQLFMPSASPAQSLLSAGQLDRLLADQGVPVRSRMATSQGAAIEALCNSEADFVWLSALGYVAAADRCPDVQLVSGLQWLGGAAVADDAPPAVIAAGAALPAGSIQSYRAALDVVLADDAGRAALDAIGGWGALIEAVDGDFDRLRSAIAAASVTDLAAWPGVSRPLRVGLVTDGGRVDDGSLNQGAYLGIQQAAGTFDIDLNFIETVEPGDFERNIATFANAGFDVIVTVGSAMAEATQAMAETYPAIRFVAVDHAFADPPPNLQGIVFREDQAGFLAGVLAGQFSASRTVGVVTGPETPVVQRYRGGFANGVASVCPDCQVIEVAIDSATDTARGKTAALSQIAEGADIIFGVGGQTGSGAVLGATQDDAWAIGADVDEYWTTFDGGATEGAGRLLTSAVKRADVAVSAAIADVVLGRFRGGEALFAAANGGIGLAPFHDAAAAVPAEVQAKLIETLEALASGRLSTGD